MTLERRLEVYELVMRQPGTSAEVTRLADSLVKYGLKDYEIDLLIDKYIGNLSFRELAKLHSYTSHRAVMRVLEELTGRLSKSKAFLAFLKGRVNG